GCRELEIHRAARPVVPPQGRARGPRPSAPAAREGLGAVRDGPPERLRRAPSRPENRVATGRTKERAGGRSPRRVSSPEVLRLRRSWRPATAPPFVSLAFPRPAETSSRREPAPP